MLLLKEQAGIKVESVGEKEITISHTLSEEEMAKLISHMIDTGSIVTGFHKKEGNLETLFMQLTGGEENATESNR